MVRKVTRAPRRGRARWFVLAGLVLVGGAGYVVHQQANALAGQVLYAAFGNADADIQGLVYPDANGNIVANDVSLYLDGALAGQDAQPGTDNSDRLHFDRMHVTVPGGWAFFVHNALDFRLQHADVDAYTLTLEGFDSKAGVDPTLGALGPIGAISASPFESEGCMAHAFFVRDELTSMGLKPGDTTLTYDVRETDSRVATRIVLNTPGVSRTQYDRDETLAKETSLLHIAETPTSTHSEHWDVADQGFVAKRNAWCAKQDGVDEATFVGHHLASVLRLLEVRGLAPDAATAAAYRDFASKGGQLSFGGTYATPLHSSERVSARRNGSALLRLQATLQQGKSDAPVQWHGTAPRPLVAQGPTFAAIVQEHGGVAPGVAALKPEEPKAPVVVRTASGVRTATNSQYASSLPAPIASAGGRLSWDDLPKYQGHLLQVYTMHAEPRTAMLVSADAHEAHVRARIDGGNADYRISRDGFVRALLIQ